MPIPHSEREVYPRNPLKEVICQLKFPPILEISGTEPIEFQNGIRLQYPFYERDEQSVDFTPDVAQMVKQLPLLIKTPPVHKFSSDDRKTAIALGQDFLAVTTSDYREWAAFSAEVERAKAVFERKYQPSFYERVGLRYKDLIDRSELGLKEKPWHELLKPFLLGLLGDENLRDEVIGATSMSLIELPSVRGGRAAVRHGHVERPEREDAYLFDADFFTAERTQKDGVTGVLAEFRSMAGDLFRWVISDDLRRALLVPHEQAR